MFGRYHGTFFLVESIKELSQIIPKKYFRRYFSGTLGRTFGEMASREPFSGKILKKKKKKRKGIRIRILGVISTRYSWTNLRRMF